MELNQIISEITTIIKDILDEQKIEEVIDQNTPLIGENSYLDSMNLVEICLALEDKSAELGFEFDWTSENAMSKSKGMFRNVKTLAEEFNNQAIRKK